MLAHNVSDFFQLLANAYQESMEKRLLPPYSGADEKVSYLLNQMRSDKLLCEEVIQLVFLETIETKQISSIKEQAVKFLERESRYDKNLEKYFEDAREKIKGIPQDLNAYCADLSFEKLNHCMKGLAIAPVAESKPSDQAESAHSINDALSRNLKFAKSALRYVKRTCVYGAYNRREDLLRTGEFNLKLIKESRDKMEFSLDLPMEIKKKASIALTQRAGNCDEQMCLTLLFLLTQQCYDLRIIEMDGGDHTFVAIGLPPYCDLSKPETIPEDAVICDSWANEYYPAKEFVLKSFTRGYLYQGQPISTYSFQDDGLEGKSYEDRNEISEELKIFINKQLTEMYPDVKSLNQKLKHNLFNELKEKTSTMKADNAKISKKQP